MSCQNFQENLPELIEGSLTPDQVVAMNGHVAECSACRQRLQAEQAVAHTLSRAFRQQVNPLTLPADFSKRLFAALQETAPVKNVPVKTAPLWETLVGGWMRYFWPTALAVCLVIGFLGFHFIFPGAPLAHDGLAPVTVAQAEQQVSIQCDFRLPTLTFHRVGNQVIDTVSYETVVASERLSRDDGEAGPEKQTWKTPL